MVKVPVFRLHKREVVAAACKPIILEAKWGGGKGSRGESGPWFEAWDGALSELDDSKKSPASGIADCPECGMPPACCDCCTGDCRCGVRHLRYY